MRLKRTASIGLLTLLVAIGPCRNREATRILRDVDERPVGVGASTLDVFRTSVESSDRVKRLIALGASAGEAARNLFTATGVEEPDTSLAVAAYVVEKVKFTAAKKTLEDFLQSDPISRGLTWSPHFAVKALLTLKNLPDSNDGHQPYSPADFTRALAAP